MNQNMASAVAPQPDKARLRSSWATEPSLREVVLIALASGLIFVLTVALFRSYVATVKSSGDYGSLVLFAAAIRHWEFHDLAAKVFWGMPYAMAGFSTITRAPEIVALLVISVVSGFFTAILSHRLWGGLVAGFTFVLNFGWIQRTYLGGNEPLFMALICGAFLFARKERWYLAALLAALATTVRPLGIFALIGIGLALLLQKKYMQVAIATAIGLFIGALYVIPIAMVYRTPMANVQGYQKGDWASGQLLSWPFAALIESTLKADVPWTNLVLSTVWVLFVTIGLVLMLRSRVMREHWREHPAEMIFAVLYICFLLTYNSPVWARADFARFAFPALPFILLSLKRWIPADRRVLWAVTVVFSVLAGCSAVGIRNVVAVIHGVIH